MKKATVLTAIIAGLVSISGHAMDSMDKMDMSATKPASAKAISGAGTVTAMDKTAGMVTLKHAPIPAIGWPAMTMGFKVKDKMLLDKVKVGDKVKFTLAPEGKDYIVTSLH